MERSSSFSNDKFNDPDHVVTPYCGNITNTFFCNDFYYIRVFKQYLVAAKTMQKT